MRARVWASYGLIVLGLISMTGYLLGHLGFEGVSRALKGVGMASMASPLPIVFSDVRGFETFAATFWVTAYFSDGSFRRVEVTPKLYSKLKGPYNRRNVYGAAISYGPRLPEDVWKSILSYGVCREGPLAKLFNETAQISDSPVPGSDLAQPSIERAIVDIRSNTWGRNDVFQLQVECAQ